MNLKAAFLRPCVRLLVVATASFIGLSSAANAVENNLPHPAKPMLWKVEGRGMKKPSYLFGTIHLGDPVVATLHPAARKAFDESTGFHAEIDLDPQNQMDAMPILMRKDGTTLNQAIGDQLAAELETELKRINPALDAAPFQQLRTFYVATSLLMMPALVKGEKPLDHVLWNEAKKSGKTTTGIQSIGNQLRVMDLLAEKEQIEILDSTLKLLEFSRNTGKSVFGDLREAYLSGDPLRIQKWVEEALTAGSENDALRDKLLGSLLRDRDAIMADYVMETLAKSSGTTHFFAMGCGHYCSEASVLNRLKDAGFTITKIDG